MQQQALIHPAQWQSFTKTWIAKGLIDAGLGERKVVRCAKNLLDRSQKRGLDACITDLANLYSALNAYCLALGRNAPKQKDKARKKAYTWLRDVAKKQALAALRYKSQVASRLAARAKQARQTKPDQEVAIQHLPAHVGALYQAVAEAKISWPTPARRIGLEAPPPVTPQPPKPNATGEAPSDGVAWFGPSIALTSDAPETPHG